LLRKSYSLHETLVSYSDNRKAREKLGWQPKTDLEEMVKRYAEWYRSIHPL
jgi:nucleoside-diphosphate-sugar epimerase